MCWACAVAQLLLTKCTCYVRGELTRGHAAQRVTTQLSHHLPEHLRTHVPVLVRGNKGGAPPPLHSASGGADGEHVPVLVRGEAYAGGFASPFSSSEFVLAFSRQVNTGLASLASSERRISATIPRSTMPPTAAPTATPAISPSVSPRSRLHGRRPGVDRRRRRWRWRWHIVTGIATRCPARRTVTYSYRDKNTHRDVCPAALLILIIVTGIKTHRLTYPLTYCSSPRRPLGAFAPWCPSRAPRPSPVNGRCVASVPMATV